MILFWIIFMLCGLSCLGFGLNLILKGLSSRRWPVAKGLVVTSIVTMENSFSHDTTRFNPEITYIYAVDGRDYEGSQVSVGDCDSSSVKSAREITGKYFQGCVVDVSMTRTILVMRCWSRDSGSLPSSSSW